MAFRGVKGSTDSQRCRVPTAVFSQRVTLSSPTDIRNVQGAQKYWKIVRADVISFVNDCEAIGDFYFYTRMNHACDLLDDGRMRDRYGWHESMLVRTQAWAALPERRGTDQSLSTHVAQYDYLLANPNWTTTLGIRRLPSGMEMPPG